MLQHLKKGLQALKAYEHNFTPSNSGTPKTIFSERFLTIEDHRPDLTVEEVKHFYKFKILINGSSFRVRNFSNFDTLINLLESWNKLGEID